MNFFIKEIITVPFEMNINNGHKFAASCSEVGRHFQWVREFVMVPCEVPVIKTSNIYLCFQSDVTIS